MTLVHAAGIDTLKLYINGALDSTHNIGFGAVNDGQLRIGSDIVGRYFQGTIDELDLFNRELSQSEIQQIYNAGPEGKCAQVDRTNNAQLQSGDNAGVALNNTNATTDTTTPVTMNTYENPEWGISMQYPSNWRATTNGLADYSDLVSFYPPLNNLSDVFPTRFKISVISYNQNISYPELRGFTLSLLNQSQLNINSSDEVTISGNPGYSVVFTDKPFRNSTSTVNTMNIWTAVGNKVYLLSYDGEESSYDKHLGELNQMLDSLRIAE
jgi:hypothetical protein